MRTIKMPKLDEEAWKERGMRALEFWNRNFAIETRAMAVEKTIRSIENLLESQKRTIEYYEEDCVSLRAPRHIPTDRASRAAAKAGHLEFSRRMDKILEVKFGNSKEKSAK